MKLTSILKPIAVVSAAAMVIGAAGCSDTSWSFKTSNKTLTNGEWIYYTYSAYSSAISKVEEDNYDGKDIATRTIEDKTGEKWIEDEAKKTAGAHLTVEKLVADYKVEIDEAEIKTYQSQYQHYYEMAKDFYEKLGVSETSFMDINVRYPYASNKLFEYIYSEEGPKAVKSDEIKKYFTDNYTDYYYISYPLTNTDDDGNTTDLDSDSIDKAKIVLSECADLFNEGKSIEDVEAKYKEGFETTSVPSSSNCAVLEDTTIGDDLKKEISALSEKSATVKTIDKVMYVFYKGDINAKAEKLDDKENADVTKGDVLYKMKNEEYKQYLEDEQAKLQFDTNEACLSKYPVSRTISIVTAD